MERALPRRARPPTYLAPVLAGDHIVSLVAPSNCSVETDPQSVTLTSGGLIRDTVEVTFSVICGARVRRDVTDNRSNLRTHTGGPLCGWDL